MSLLRARGVGRAACGAILVSTALVGCSDTNAPVATNKALYELANGCFSLAAGSPGQYRYLRAAEDGTNYAFTAETPDDAARFLARPADLGVYLLRDVDGGYLIGENARFGRTTVLISDVLLNQDSYVSPAEWQLEARDGSTGHFSLHNRALDRYLGPAGARSRSVQQALDVTFVENEGCAPFPELTLDATGTVRKTHFDDGTLYGIADQHSHLFTNFGFGAGGTFHGSPFHRLGVEHALPDCEPFHGPEGSKDILGFFYGGGQFDVGTATTALIFGDTGQFNHYTAGYPEFTDWPGPPGDDTHQTQYYRWIERAYLGGLRLIVQHATSNQVLCELVTGAHAQTGRISCDEMVSAERTIDETYALERYIDALHGGPGKGWLRVVTSPAQAREVIGQGKLAVVLGIETSNLFDCLLTPRAGSPTCDLAYVRQQIDHFHDRGVRALFPVHKFDNLFSAGDGSRGFLEFGNFINSGHYSNYVTDCPANVTAVFDRGGITFGSLNRPRVDYLAPADVDMSRFATDPVATLFPFIDVISDPGLSGAYCQNAGFTSLGEQLVNEMMLRGMILEIDHLPQRSYARVLEMLQAADYPAAATHGSEANGMVYALGGISTSGIPRCADPNAPENAAAGYRDRIARISANGGYPSQGFGFDLNGFAGKPGPRFGPLAHCAPGQVNPVTYPFTSFDGDVTFEQPHLGNRVVDFNEEGMVHLGLLPELLQDARNMGFSDADLEPFFHSAESYIRMWERAEARGAALSSGGLP